MYTLFINIIIIFNNIYLLNTYSIRAILENCFNTALTIYNIFINIKFFIHNCR